MQTTRINRPWALKIILFGTVMFLFGLYGLYDATVDYPRRGERFASYALFQYLEAASERGVLDRAAVSIENPVSEYRRLGKSSPQGFELTRYRWLDSLAKIGQLKPERTALNAPAETYRQLRTAWYEGDKARNAPKELASYDIPVQWIFFAIGIGGAIWLGGLFLSVRARKYSWDPESRTLTLPGGQALTPADLEDVDKRKWDKFLVFLKIKPSHPALGGRELKLDLYRHAPLEEWVLEMERTAFPERAAEAKPPDPSMGQGGGATGPEAQPF
jgi:hypothetical protein